MDLNFQKYISCLILLYLENKLNEKEEKELEEWRNATIGHEELFQKMISTSHFKESVKCFVKTETEREVEWQLIRQRTLGKKRMLWKKIWYYAALWILPLLIGGGIFYGLKEYRCTEPVVATSFIPGGSHAILELADGTQIDLKAAILKEGQFLIDKNWDIVHDSLKYKSIEKNTMEEYHTLKVPRGGEYTLVLADGTRVFLNAESSLKYPVHFTGSVRKVTLEGEAYFEVHPDATKPFVVDVNQMKVRVLGTSFGIRAYSGEKEVLTTLVSGKVNVSTKDKEIVLNPLEQAVFDKNSNRLGMSVVDTDLFVGWKDGRLVFDNCPLERVLSDLSRWYSFEVFYASQAVKEIPFSLNIRKHEKFADVLQLMQNTGKIHFAINKNTVIVK